MLVIQVFDQYSIVSETLKNQYYQMKTFEHVLRLSVTISTNEATACFPISLPSRPEIYRLFYL
jgi:hypothetical protein